MNEIRQHIYNSNDNYIQSHVIGLYYEAKCEDILKNLLFRVIEEYVTSKAAVGGSF